MKFISPIIVSLIILSGCGASESSDQGQSFSLGQPYMYTTDNQLQMSVKSFMPANGRGPKVTLVGMIHIGEPSYYQQVQERINQANFVLWEGIGNPHGDSYLAKAALIPACQTLSE